MQRAKEIQFVDFHEPSLDIGVWSFANACGSYDSIAKCFPAYGFIYRFIELILEIAYFMAVATLTAKIANCVVTSLGTIGVVSSPLIKAKIQCACLGTVLNFPWQELRSSEISPWLVCRQR